MATDCLISQWQHGGMSNFLRQWREARGLTLEQVGSAIGSDKTQISKLEKGDRKLSVQWLERLASFYGVSPGDLLKQPDAPPPAPNVDLSTAVDVPRVVSMPLDLPVYGVAIGGPDGDFSLNGEIVDRVRRPPGLMGNSKAFAVFVRGESMEPRHYQGDLLYVDPVRPARAGDDVLVEMKPARPAEPGAAFIKQLVSYTPVRLVIRQFNPAKDITLQTDKVLRVYKILKLADLLGL